MAPDDMSCTSMVRLWRAVLVLFEPTSMTRTGYLTYTWAAASRTRTYAAGIRPRQGLLQHDASSTITRTLRAPLHSQISEIDPDTVYRSRRAT